MAEVNGNKRDGYTTSITEDVNMGDAGQGIVNTMFLQLVAQSSWDGSVVIAGRKKGSSESLVTINYVDRTTSGNTISNAAITGTSTNKLIQIDATGMDIFVRHTQGAGPTGSLKILPVRMVG